MKICAYIQQCTLCMYVLSNDNDIYNSDKWFPVELMIMSGWIIAKLKIFQASSSLWSLSVFHLRIEHTTLQHTSSTHISSYCMEWSSLDMVMEPLSPKSLWQINDKSREGFKVEKKVWKIPQCRKIQPNFFKLLGWFWETS